MLPTSGTPTRHRQRASTHLERIVHRLRAPRTDRSAIAGAPDRDEEQLLLWVEGWTSERQGFDWHAPAYARPGTHEDTRRMLHRDRDDRTTTQTTTTDTDGPFRWRRHPFLLKQQLSADSALPENERLARLAAVRGVLAARNGELAEASAFFADAAREPTIRFQVVPGFWGCTRGALEAAVVAYEEAGRFRDAAALSATIRTRFRPRAMSIAPAEGRITALEQRSGRDEAGTGD